MPGPNTKNGNNIFCIINKYWKFVTTITGVIIVLAIAIYRLDIVEDNSVDAKCERVELDRRVLTLENRFDTELKHITNSLAKQEAHIDDIKDILMKGNRDE